MPCKRFGSRARRAVGVRRLEAREARNNSIRGVDARGLGGGVCSSCRRRPSAARFWPRVTMMSATKSEVVDARAVYCHCGDCASPARTRARARTTASAASLRLADADDYDDDEDGEKRVALIGPRATARQAAAVACARADRFTSRLRAQPAASSAAAAAASRSRPRHRRRRRAISRAVYLAPPFAGSARAPHDENCNRDAARPSLAITRRFSRR